MCASTNRFELMTIYLIQKFKFELLRFCSCLVLFCACSLLRSFRLNANHLIRHIHIHIHTAPFRCTNWNLIDSRFSATATMLVVWASECKRTIGSERDRRESRGGKEQFPNGNSIEYFKTWKLILSSFIEMSVYSFGSKYDLHQMIASESKRNRPMKKTNWEKPSQNIDIDIIRRS